MEDHSSHTLTFNTPFLTRLMVLTTGPACGTGLLDQQTGTIVTPVHGKLSIAKGIRIYSSDGCKSCNPVVYVLEGRTDEQSPYGLKFIEAISRVI